MIKRTVVLSKPSYLSTKQEQMVIRYPGEDEDKIRVPIEDIGLVLLESQQITITNGLLNKLVENKAVVVSCDKKHMPASLTLPMSGHTLSGERYKHQIKASLPLKKGLWKQTIKAKLINQGRVLEFLGEDPEPLYKWSKKVLSGDSGFHESRAAAYYWPRLIKSPTFRRDPEGDPPNNLFNYTYAILRGIIARALVGSGLLPGLGIFHKNKYNSYPLADDIMEPYRPLADALVMDLYMSCEKHPKLDTFTKSNLLTLPTMDVLVGGNKSPLMVAASRTSNSLYECFEGTRRKILYPEYAVYT